MGTVSTTNNKKGNKVTTSPVSGERRIKKAAPVAVVTEPTTAAPKPTERRVKAKPVIAPETEATIEPAEVITPERRKENAPATPADIKNKKSKAELKAEKQQRLLTPAAGDLKTLLNNLTILDEYGEESIPQLKEYFGEPFKGTRFDPSTLTDSHIIMWVVPWRKRMAGLGDDKNGKMLTFKRFELSLLGTTGINGQPHYVIYPLDGDVAAAMPTTDWYRTGMGDCIVIVPEEQPAFDNFLTDWAKRLPSDEG